MDNIPEMIYYFKNYYFLYFIGYKFMIIIKIRLAECSSGISRRRRGIGVASKWYDFIDISFLPFELKERYKEEIRERLGKFKSPVTSKTQNQYF